MRSRLTRQQWPECQHTFLLFDDDGVVGVFFFLSVATVEFYLPVVYPRSAVWVPLEEGGHAAAVQLSCLLLWRHLVLSNHKLTVCLQGVHKQTEDSWPTSRPQQCRPVNFNPLGFFFRSGHWFNYQHHLFIFSFTSFHLFLFCSCHSALQQSTPGLKGGRVRERLLIIITLPQIHEVLLVSDTSACDSDCNKAPKTILLPTLPGWWLFFRPKRPSLPALRQSPGVQLKTVVH